MAGRAGPPVPAGPVEEAVPTAAWPPFPPTELQLDGGGFSRFWTKGGGLGPKARGGSF
jgi:hypothetical protein